MSPYKYARPRARARAHTHTHTHVLTYTHTYVQVSANSLEQLCINFANESLQMLFNKKVLEAALILLVYAALTY